ncbi:CBS domain-containing protein [Catellatospora vulcania]|uniref:CBS domain-containing protein n=1 Tax=Catellatospora vulcania TaxID=1460450 RepID=UPI0012D4333C|nr:CBS domain-containing protein [Catellatospora vulcania]
MDKRIAQDRPDRAAGLAWRQISEVMSAPPYSVPTSTTLGDALAVMVREGLRHLVVTDEGGRCVGVLADRSVVAAWAAEPAALSYRRVSSVLDRTPAVVAGGAAVVDAARLMRTACVDAVAVVDARGVAVGVVTGSDLVALLAR